MRYPPDHKARSARNAAARRCTFLEDLWFQRHRGGWPGRRRGRDVGRVLFELPEQGSDAARPSSTPGLGEPFLSDTDSATRTEGRARLLDFLQEYISTDHSLDAAEGCVMPALSADVSRAEPPVKDAYQRKMTALIDRIAGTLDGEQSDRQRRAWSIVALMVGSIVISRGMPEQSQSRSAPLDSALSTASMLVDARRLPPHQRLDRLASRQIGA